MIVLHHPASAAVLAAVALAVAACAAPRRVEAPEVRAAEVRVVVLDYPRVRLAIDVTLDNPNDVAIGLAAVDVVVEVEGAPVARASLAAPATLAARAPTRVRIDATGDLSAVLAGAARSLARGAMRYEVGGAAVLADGRRVPFRKRGVVAHS